MQCETASVNGKAGVEMRVAWEAPWNTAGVAVSFEVAVLETFSVFRSSTRLHLSVLTHHYQSRGLWQHPWLSQHHRRRHITCRCARWLEITRDRIPQALFALKISMFLPNRHNSLPSARHGWGASD